MLERIQPAPGMTARDASGDRVTRPIVVDTNTAYYRKRIAEGMFVKTPKAKKEAKKDG